MRADTTWRAQTYRDELGFVWSAQKGTWSLLSRFTTCYLRHILTRPTKLLNNAIHNSPRHDMPWVGSALHGEASSRCTEHVPAISLSAKLRSNETRGVSPDRVIFCVPRMVRYLLVGARPRPHDEPGHLLLSSAIISPVPAWGEICIHSIPRIGPL